MTEIYGSFLHKLTEKISVSAVIPPPSGMSVFNIMIAQILFILN